MVFYENVFEFITDGSKRLSSRATVVILTIFCVALVGNIIGFSHYYNKQRQLDQLKSIAELLNDTAISPETKNELVKLENQTFKRKNVIDYSIAYTKEYLVSSKESKISKESNSFERNEIWFLISTSGFYILTTLVVVPTLLLTDRKTPF